MNLRKALKCFLISLDLLIGHTFVFNTFVVKTFRSFLKSSHSNNKWSFVWSWLPHVHFKSLMTTYKLPQWRKIPEDLNSQKHRCDNPKWLLTHYCLLQVLVAALLLVSCAHFTKRYPDPLDCHNYYLRRDENFDHRTCRNNLVFDQYIQQCTLNNCTLPKLRPLNGTDCNQNKKGYYCNTDYSFT